MTSYRRSYFSRKFTEAVETVLPSVKRKNAIAGAKKSWSEFCDPKNHTSQLVFMRLPIVEGYLSRAGYDINSDAPYQDVLGLRDGKAEYDDYVRNKYRSAALREWKEMLDEEFWRMRLSTLETYIEKSGYDIGADLPYEKILGLKGGKAEFDQMVGQLSQKVKSKPPNQGPKPGPK